MNETLWNTDKMLEVSLKEPDDFLKVRETLSRIGVSSRKEKKLFQSCHILHKQGKYYIVHFKELFALDGKEHAVKSTIEVHCNYTAAHMQAIHCTAATPQRPSHTPRTRVRTHDHACMLQCSHTTSTDVDRTTRTRIVAISAPPSTKPFGCVVEYVDS